MFVLGLIAFMIACFIAPYVKRHDDNLLVVPMMVFMFGGLALMAASVLVFFWTVLP